ncbi:acyl-CoA dehydrogenase family protein [Phenylobacterium soli]|uniref:Acyl-CoA dehydrogenase n=1 Tax=Phenylobacterium soli TaxID=2170551 RepID=A0A328A9D0_9CAUL|nr:acyl-CoA dehydrogenase family protein [Phenylobacterium soli]RAK51129.1 acyl-CoA dehydrogenase [Phenylobacterium soli]
MRFALSEDQKMLQASVGKAIADLAPLDRVRRYAEGKETIAADIWAGLSDLGLPGLMIPEAHGGLGLGLLEAAVAAEALGGAVAPTPFLGSAVLAPLALTLGGTPEQQARWLPKLASGEATAGVCIAEAVAGARDGAGVVAKDGRLEGFCLFGLDAQDADLLVVADRDGKLWLAERPAETAVMSSIDETRRLSEVIFAGTPAEPLASNEALTRLRDAAWVVLAAEMLGAGQTMLEKAVAYAKERKQFGRVIGSFQAVKHLCAEMAAELEPARALVWYAAYAFDHAPEEASLMAAHAKAHLSEIGRFVARTSTEVHGGIGMTDLLGLHYWFKRLGQNRQLLGGPEKVREYAARVQGLAA